MAEFRPCAVIPTYDNAPTIADVARRVGAHLQPVIVVDDGSGPEAAAIMDQLETDGVIKLCRRAKNGGKGAAVKSGLAFAAELGFTHAFQVDADGQHDIDAMPTFLDAARTHPESLVLARPIYGEDAPKSRLAARKITQFWVNVQTWGRVIADPMVGFRVYPVQSALATGTKGDRMDFDIEVAVRMVWADVPVINLPVKVRYLTEEEGGVSHFQMVRDNLRITRAHFKLTTIGIFRQIAGALGVGGGQRKRLE